jgi:hypothetical protein
VADLVRERVLESQKREYVEEKLYKKEKGVEKVICAP